MKEKILRGLLFFWTAFIGLGAVGGAVTMFLDPSGATSGMNGLLPGLRKLPFAETLFANLIFAGISLLIVNGLTQLATFALLWRHKKHAAVCGLGCGFLLMLWICIQFVIYPRNLLSIAYFCFGALEAAAGLLLYLQERRA